MPIPKAPNRQNERAEFRMKGTRQILIIDRQSRRTDLIRRMLEEREIQCDVITLDSPCLEEVLEEEAHDIILIGSTPTSAVDFEVYRKLQEHRRARQKPILFAIEKKNGGALDVAIDVEETFAYLKRQLDLIEAARENNELRERLEESRGNASLGVASLAVIHNINNFLGVAIGYMELLKMNRDYPEKVLQFHSTIEQAHNRIITTLQSVAAMGQNARDYPHVPVNLPDLFSRLVDRLQRKINLRPKIGVAFIGPCRQLSTHPEVLENILIHLLVNAWESYGNSDHGERLISISIRKDEQSLETKESALIIAVSDRGAGLASTIREDPFAPFATTKEAQGAGMGLTVARYSIRRMGGELELHENPEGGVTAEVRHPI